MFVVLALIAGYLGYKRLVPPLDQRTTYELGGDLLVHGNPTLKELAITFDDGPYGETTEDILRTLKDNDVQATFFVVGRHVDERPELVRRIMSEGHEVGNHTYSHPRLTQITHGQAKVELEMCEEAVFNATGAHMNLMRPPGMNFDDGLLSLAQDMGYTTVHWNALAGDYLPVEPGMIVKRVLWQVQPGSVILLHDSPDTARALPELVRRLKADGYRFVTVTQMLARLPRPVFLASNAGAVNWKETLPPIEERPAARAKRPQRRSSAQKPPTSAKPAVDVPTWDGPKDDVVDKSEASVA
jgi:peptidoglycan-N-acetylglucosamine deacetylase